MLNIMSEQGEKGMSWCILIIGSILGKMQLLHVIAPGDVGRSVGRSVGVRRGSGFRLRGKDSRLLGV